MRWTTVTSVRDHSQSARLEGARITVVNKCGRQAIHTYHIPRSSWMATRKSANPHYSQRELVTVATFTYEDDPLSDRIRDAQVRAINQALNFEAVA